jgi:hypothetical protein
MDNPICQEDVKIIYVINRKYMKNNQLYNQTTQKKLLVVAPGPLKLKIMAIFGISDPKNIGVQSSISN